MNKQLLIDYIEQGKSQREIAKLIGKSQSNVGLWIRKYGLKTHRMANISTPNPPCLNCGKEVKRKDKKYCSNGCSTNHRRTTFLERWKSGEEDGIVGYQTSGYIRKYLFEKYENKCCKCGWGEAHPDDGKVPLELEHKDGDYTNNEETNLELLCPNCHSLTSTYKGRNTGNGRKQRKKYSLKTG